MTKFSKINSQRYFLSENILLNFVEFSFGNDADQMNTFEKKTFN